MGVFDIIWVRILFVALLIFIVNIPFGALRSKVKKFSFLWFLYIHLPVPLVILFRMKFDIGFAFYTYPILLGAFFLGQLFGRKKVINWCRC